MNLSLLKLINSYFFKGFFGPFFVIFFPIMILFIMGNAFYKPDIQAMRNIVGGILITSTIAIAMLSIPVAVIEFKKSTMIKRIGAARINVRVFLTTVSTYYFGWIIFSVFWILLWSGIIIGTKPGMNWSVAFVPHFLSSLPFMFLTLIVCVSIGIMIVSLLNTIQGVMSLTNVLYFPMSLLSGAFIPKTSVDHSSVLNAITYVLPTKYSVDPFFKAWTGGFESVKNGGWEVIGFPAISICFTIVFFGIAIKNFRWSE